MLCSTLVTRANVNPAYGRKINSADEVPYALTTTTQLKILVTVIVSQDGRGFLFVIITINI